MQKYPVRAGAVRARALNSLQLAYIGDSVYDLYVRSYLIRETDIGAGGLHKRSIARVCANAQSKALALIEEMLDVEEHEVLKRGKNADVGKRAGNSSPVDYMRATAIEALIGYLYLSGKDERLSELFDVILSKSENKANG